MLVGVRFDELKYFLSTFEYFEISRSEICAIYVLVVKLSKTLLKKTKKKTQTGEPMTSPSQSNVAE